jgi:hypothetical protein
MARNIEIKEQIDDYDALIRIAAAPADSSPTEIIQDDTFLGCPNERMKLRVFPHGEGELIFYHRPDKQVRKSLSI